MHSLSFQFLNQWTDLYTKFDMNVMPLEATPKPHNFLFCAVTGNNLVEGTLTSLNVEY
jgi:hypothetical protein